MNKRVKSSISGFLFFILVVLIILSITGCNSDIQSDDSSDNINTRQNESITTDIPQMESDVLTIVQNNNAEYETNPNKPDVEPIDKDSDIFDDNTPIIYESEIISNDTELSLNETNRIIADAAIAKALGLITPEGNFMLALRSLSDSMNEYPDNEYLWHAYSDLRDGGYYFNTTYTPNGIYIDSNNTAYILSGMFNTPKKLMDNVRSVHSMTRGNRYTTNFLITTNNELWAFGYNGNGEVGDDTGMKMNRSDPVFILDNVANMVFKEGSSAVWAIKTDESLWAWGKNATNVGANTYAPICIQDNYNINFSLLEEHITSINGNLEVHPMDDLSDDIVFALGGIENIVSSMRIPISLNTNRTSSRYYALTADGVLWGWGYNNGGLGDGTKADRDSPVLIAENVKRLLPNHFIKENNDWYLYSYLYNAPDAEDYTPVIALTNCLYAHKLTLNSTASNGIWFTPDGKLCESSRSLTAGYKLYTNIRDIKLPNIVRFGSSEFWQIPQPVPSIEDDVITILSTLSEDSYVPESEVIYSDGYDNLKPAWIDGEIVNIRTEPTLESDIIDKLARDTEVKLIKIEEEWGYIYIDGMFGYVFLEFLRLTE